MVTNNGNVTETLEQPALTNFTVSVNPAQLAPGATAVYTVQPKAGLDVGAYSETIKVSSDKSVIVNFQVVKGNAVLTKIQQPAAVTGLANGTKKDASSLKLPSTVVVETTEGSMKAAVSWNVKEASYKQSSTDAQKFTVSGTVTLPSGVDNDNKISLATSVEVSVNAYSAKVASAENNKITGIDVNGVYTTQTKISFTAVGAGMDNNSPKKGDTRYVPQSWTVINTNVWNAAPVEEAATVTACTELFFTVICWLSVDLNVNPDSATVSSTASVTSVVVLPLFPPSEVFASFEGSVVLSAGVSSPLF